MGLRGFIGRVGMSGPLSVQPAELLARLKSRRAIAGIAIAVLALGGGGYYFCNHSPESANAMMFSKPVALTKGAAPNRRKATTTSPSSDDAPATQPAVVDENAVVVDQDMVDELGAAYVDVGNGYSVRFPEGWAIRTFRADPWVLDCGDVAGAMISVGFTPCPADVTADRLLPEAIARRIRKTPGTTLLAQGRTLLGGRKALWFKSTGPLLMTNGSPMMTRVQYIVPLGDGRLMQLRLAAPPQMFASLSNTMKQTVDTFTIIPRPGAPATRQ